MSAESPRSLPPLRQLYPKVLMSFLRSSKTGTQDVSASQIFRLTQLDQAQLQGFRAYFDFVEQDQPPLVYWYLLAQRAQIALLVQPVFPLPLPGIVHFGNTLHQEAPYQADQPIDIGVSVFMAAKAEGSLFPVLMVNFRQGGKTFLSCQSDYFFRRKRQSPKKKKEREAPTFLQAEQQEHWELAADTGRIYARLSGDFNPIHLYPWFARLSGFPRRIIHGWYSLSRALATIERGRGEPISFVSVQFKKPLLLPGEATLHWRTEEDGTAFQLTDPGQSLVMLEGEAR